VLTQVRNRYPGFRFFQGLHDLLLCKPRTIHVEFSFFLDFSTYHWYYYRGCLPKVIDREIDWAAREAWSTLSDGYVDEGWHDTVLVLPGERVKILLKFEDFTGLYLYHCHNLEHEDMGMMRNFRVDA